ncbi:MAG: spermidine synthase [Verrucomicrobiota bacterium]|nr:spermidine synthase [Verrucomicrobiota bacterium]
MSISTEQEVLAPTPVAVSEPGSWIINGVRLRIFLVSFTLLFFELHCIRWIPAYVRYLSYFTNFILLASFLGMGLGILTARRATFRFPPFPLMVLLLAAVVALNRFELNISSTDVLYFGSGMHGVARAESFILLPLIFSFVAAAFIPLGRTLGLLFTQTAPLTAYTFDILGSLAGTAAFFVIGFFALPPIYWFAVLGLLVLVLSTKRQFIHSAGMLIAAAGIALFLQRGTYWSPYYKITLTPATPAGYNLDVNSIGHQSMIPWRNKEPFYRRVYELFPGASFERALILGAGSGSDTATALANGVQTVTAVEIDPVIMKLGAKFHPDQPYSDPRVRLVNADGRVFLRNTNEKFDLIIFALPDSLTLTSSIANLRLESFLFTQDALAAARDALSPNGVLVLYNYYREPWLIEKLASMVGRTFGRDSFVSTYGGQGRGAVIVNGPRLGEIPAGAFGRYREEASSPADKELRVTGEGFFAATDKPPATDDWPFIYLPKKSFPAIYLRGLAVILAISLAAIFLVAPRSILRRFDWHMFFLGVAFALLEVKALTTFALLFGSTWNVNSLVFFAILTSVLIAVLVNARFMFRRIWIFYVLLFGMLVLNLVVRPEALLLQNAIARYVIASSLIFAPVFLANVIFSNSFRETELADVAFASNLLGIMVGGMLEYFSMLAGYHMLLVAVIAFYFLAMVLRARAKLVRS